MTKLKRAQNDLISKYSLSLDKNNTQGVTLALKLNTFDETNLQ